MIFFFPHLINPRRVAASLQRPRPRHPRRCCVNTYVCTHVNTFIQVHYVRICTTSTLSEGAGSTHNTHTQHTHTTHTHTHNTHTHTHTHQSQAFLVVVAAARRLPLCSALRRHTCKHSVCGCARARKRTRARASVPAHVSLSLSATVVSAHSAARSKRSGQVGCRNRTHALECCPSAQLSTCSHRSLPRWLHPL